MMSKRLRPVRKLDSSMKDLFLFGVDFYTSRSFRIDQTDWQPFTFWDFGFFLSFLVSSQNFKVVWWSDCVFIQTYLRIWNKREPCFLLELVCGGGGDDDDDDDDDVSAGWWAGTFSVSMWYLVSQQQPSSCMSTFYKKKTEKKKLLLINNPRLDTWKWKRSR